MANLKFRKSNSASNSKTILYQMSQEVESNIVYSSKGACADACLLEFLKNIITDLDRSKRIGTADNFRKLLNSVSSYMDGRDVRLSEFDESVVDGYNDWLVSRGLCRNSISFYMRNLKTAYLKAVKLKYVMECYPFENVYTGIAKTRKRAISEIDLIRLSKLVVSGSDSLSFAKDMFLFSYCTRGMAYVDIAYLKKSNIVNNSIVYQRKKTGQRLVVGILPQMQIIMDRYFNAGSEYIFPIITSADEVEAYRQYRCSLIYYNRLLKLLAVMMGGRNTIDLVYSSPHLGYFGKSTQCADNSYPRWNGA